VSSVVRAEVAAVLDGFVGGLVGGILALVGVWLGPIVQQRLRKKGHVRYRLSDFTWEDEQYPGDYTFVIKIFNELEQGTGIRDVDVEFYDNANGELQLTDRPKHTGELGYHVDYLNLPAQQWTVGKLKAGDIAAEPEKMRRAKGCKARIIIRPPGNTKHIIEIPKKGKDAVEQIIPGRQH
jgi:hypothetical protein